MDSTDIAETITEDEYRAALEAQQRIARIAERRLPLYANLRQGKPSHNAERAWFRSLDDEEVELYYDDTYDERERFYLPLAILTEPGFEERAQAEIAARDEAAAEAKAAKAAAEAAAREQADRATYERLRARFEEGATA